MTACPQTTIAGMMANRVMMSILLILVLFVNVIRSTVALAMFTEKVLYILSILPDALLIAVIAVDEH